MKKKLCEQPGEKNLKFVPKNKNPFKINLLEIGVQFGLILFVPLAIFILAGSMIDKILNTAPAFILTGLFLGIISSSVALYAKINDIFKELQLIKKP